MNKALVIISLLILKVSTFSFSLDSLEFNETIKRGELKEKEYVLINNTNEVKKYSVSGSLNNIEIKPKTFILSPEKKQKLNLKVLGEGKVGENKFTLTIIEKNLNKDNTKKNPVYLNKVVRIKQKYFLK